jgi:hypothetical protein
MADIEQGKSQAQAIEFMESSDGKGEIVPVRVAAVDQTRIRRKVSSQAIVQWLCIVSDFGRSSTRRCCPSYAFSMSYRTSIVAILAMRKQPAS